MGRFGWDGKRNELIHSIEIFRVTSTEIFFLTSTAQPERPILRQQLLIVQILVSRQATVNGLSQQVGEQQLSVLPPARQRLVPSVVWKTQVEQCFQLTVDFLTIATTV